MPKFKNDFLFLLNFCFRNAIAAAKVTWRSVWSIWIIATMPMGSSSKANRCQLCKSNCGNQPIASATSAAIFQDRTTKLTKLYRNCPIKKLMNFLTYTHNIVLYYTKLHKIFDECSYNYMWLLRRTCKPNVLIKDDYWIYFVLFMSYFVQRLIKDQRRRSLPAKNYKANITTVNFVIFTKSIGVDK